METYLIWVLQEFNKKTHVMFLTLLTFKRVLFRAKKVEKNSEKLVGKQGASG